MKFLLQATAVHYCLIFTFISTLCFYIVTNDSLYTTTSLFAGLILTFFNIVEDEIIHKNVHQD